MSRIGRTCGAAALLLGLLAPNAQAAPIIFSATGATAADIQATVDAFRTAVGSPNNGTVPGPLTGGRREINWDDGVPFQEIRGATVTSSGGVFLGTLAEFAAINPSYATTFAPFSGARLFAPLDTTVTDVTFSVPGTGGSTPAFVSGFGAVFSDVDTPFSSLSFFGPGGSVLAALNVPALAGSQTFSFLGVIFNAGEQVERVSIGTGFAALGLTDGGSIDVVVLDDFIYSEPVAVPEPGPLALLAVGLAGIAAARRSGGPRSRAG